jgi:hypothetical protein
LGCEEFTGLSDDGTLENKYYFAYNRTCQLAGAADCQTFYTWDNPDGFDKSIKSYTLKADGNQPVVTEDDSYLCNEDIYNLGIDPYCYKFYAVRGGENIDLNTLESSAYVSYHLIDKTITCSNDCKPYRLGRAVTESQCLGKKGADLNKFDNGTCTVYAILGENNNCSALNVGCREYRGSRSHAYFTLLMETFERAVSNDVWKGGDRVKEAVQKDGYSWQNLGSNEVLVNLERPVNQDQLYLLTFWARRASTGSDRLQISLTGATQYFTEDGGINLDTRWQRYVLGPVQMTADSENPILLFSGMNVGNLFIDNVELREVDDSYYFIANSWSVSDFCDKIPDTNITVPGYMLGCDGYQDSFGYKHYLKSFTANCRADAVGCELVIDTQNNLEGSDYTYNAKPLKEIGNLVLPVVENETACVSGGNIWERGHCHKTFTASSINKKQCELWGYYWLGAEDTGKCVNDTVADDLFTPADKLMTLVLDQKYLCAASANGCSAYGKAVTDANDKPMACDLGTVCSTSKGCTCRDANTNDYICTVSIGQQTCQMDTVYAINNPLQYSATLCTANSKGCDKFTDSQNSIWYFRNPGNRLCEYKELRIGGQLKTGWFIKGTETACYPDYSPQFGLWGADQNWDYKLAGIDDLKNYDFYVGSCSVTANMCTKFVDPTADDSNQRNYYLLDNGGVDTNSCNGQVNLAEGCVLLNNTGKNAVNYSAEKTYVANFQADYQPVGPQPGIADKSLNPLTGYTNPYYRVAGTSATAAGFVRVDLGSGILQSFPYVIPVFTEADSSSVGLLQQLGNIGDSNSGIILPGVNLQGSIVLQGVNIPSVSSNVNITPDVWSNEYAQLYQDILGEMAKQGDASTFVNNTNTVVKVQRDRSCAEWLSPADQEVVYDSTGKANNTTFNLLSCQNMSSGECTKLAPALPPQYLDYRLYTLRGFGWNTLDYSGYSLPNRYSLADYKQVYVPAEDRLALALDWKEQCNKDSDCDVTGSKCLAGRCYDLKGGQQAKYDLVSCRAYPEASSPFVYSLGNPILQSEQVNRCYPMTGYCADQFSGTVKDYNLSCYSDLDCKPLQRCVFDNKSTNDDCDCNYTKLSYSDLGGVSIYTDLNDDKLSSMGLCSGGVNDGLPCFGDNECLGTQNRTMFRATSTLKVFQSEEPNGRCVFPSNAQKQQGWKGFCLEKDVTGQCITWWPVNRLLGDEDLYYKDKTVGLPYLNRYYCLHEDTLYKRVLVGGYNATKDTVGVYATKTIPGGGLGGDDDVTDWGLFFRTMLRASHSYKTDIFYLSDDERFPLMLDFVDDVVSTVPFYPGAIVKVEGKLNFTNNSWIGDTDFQIASGYGNVKPKAILEYIKERWEGQSCFYMILDVVDKYTNMFCKIGDDDDVECPSFDSNIVANSGASPIIVSCSLGQDVSKAEIINYPVEMNLNLADKISFIKGLYEQHQNRCTVGIFTGADPAKVFDLFQRVCEYNNIRQVDYPLLFAALGDRNVWRNQPNVFDDAAPNFSSKRFTSANVGGTEKICDLMAEVRDEDGNNRAYTDNFSKDKAFSLWNVAGKDYVFDASSKIVYATDTTDLPSAGTDYRIPSLGKLGASNDEKIQYYLSHQAVSYKILPIIVPRALVKNKLDLYTSPQPFGAIMGNNLYQPYVLPKEGSNMLSRMLMIDDDTNETNNSLNNKVYCPSTSAECSGNNKQNRTTAQLKLDKANEKYKEYVQNNLFSLFNGVYSLKEYRVNLASVAGEVPMLFANKVMATYQDSTPDRLQLYAFNSSEVGPSIKYAGEYVCAVHNRSENLIQDIGKNDILLTNGISMGSGLMSSLLSDTHEIICKPNYLVSETGCGWYYGVDELSDQLSYTCNDLSGEEIVAIGGVETKKLNIQKPRIQLLNQESPPVIPVYTIYNNKQLSLDFYGYADKNALPIRKLAITWGDNQESSYNGFIQNHQEVCDSEAYINAESSSVIADLATLDTFKTNNAQWIAADFYGSCGPVCINWPIASTGTEVKGTICYDTDKTKLADILRASGETIPTNNQIPQLLEGRVYGNLYKQSLRCAIKDWDRYEGDLCIPVFNVVDGRFIDSICESSLSNKFVANATELYGLSGDSAVINPIYTNFQSGFTNVFSLNISALNLNVWNPLKDATAATFLSAFRTHFNAEKRIYDLYTQGAAGDRKNCVAKPFSFKHWYQNIVSTNDAGKFVCNFGQPLDNDGVVVANGSDDVVYCKLIAKIEIEDNMGKVSIQNFTVMVPVRLILSPFTRLNMSLQASGSGESTLSNWVTGLVGGGFIVPKPAVPNVPRFIPLSP